MKREKLSFPLCRQLKGVNKMQKKVYTPLEISVNIFNTELVIAASSGNDQFIDDKGNNDTEIL